MKKIISLLLVICMSAVLFAGCGKSSESTKAAETKTLKVATNAEFKPFESLDADQNVVGFDVDLMNAIGEKIGMKIEFKNMEFDSVVASIPAGTCDAAISGLTINAKRQKTVDFSEPYYSGAAQILIVKSDDKAFTGTTKEQLDSQLKNKKIGVCTGFTGAAYANGDEEWGFAKIEGATVKTYDNITLAIADLKSSNIDVIIMDDTPAKEAVAQAANKDSIKAIDVALTVESYGIAVKKGNTELKQKIDTALAELKSSGKVDELMQKWEVK